MKHQITFLLAGMITGLICVAFGSFESPEIAIIGLTWGVGPLFFVAVLAGIAITGAWHQLQVGFWRYLVGLILITITYVMALTAFFWVTGVAPNWFGIRESEDIVDFRMDVWLGLIAAGAVGASGIALSAALLTGKWSNSLLLRLMLAGWVTILITFLANLPFHTYWSFLGVLLPLGNALFCYFVGTQIGQRPEAGRHVAATVSEPHHRPA
jgi:CDP-diglyceride synthetase